MLNKNLSLLVIAFSLSSCCIFDPQCNKNGCKESPLSIEHQAVFGEVDQGMKVSPEEKKYVNDGKILATVNFAFNSASLDKNSLANIKKLVSIVNDPEVEKVIVEAHCDERGKEIYNQKLSERRAAAVKKALVKNGAKAQKISTFGYGETKPIDPGHNEAAWAKNRRAVVIKVE